MMENRTFPLNGACIRADALSPTSVPDRGPTPNPPFGYVRRCPNGQVGHAPRRSPRHGTQREKGPDRHGGRDLRDAVRTAQIKR